MPDTCRRVTGKAFEPHYWTLEPERQGKRRSVDEVNPRKQGCFTSSPPEAVYDVLCGDRVRYDLMSLEDDGLKVTSVCAWCLSATVDNLGVLVVVRPRK